MKTISETLLEKMKVDGNNNTLIMMSKSDLMECIVAVIDEYKAIEKELASQEEETTHEEQSEYLSAKEVCKLFGISEPTLWRWDNKQKTFPIKQGGLRYYKRTDIETLIK